jgi:hypothetical protein
MSAMSENLWPFKAVFSFGNSQKLHGAKSGEYGGWSNFNIEFWPKTPRQQARHEQGHCHDARSNHQAKAQVFSDAQPYVTLPVFPNNGVGSLFDFVQETQSEQFLCDQKTNEHCVHWARDMRAFFDLGYADVFHCMFWRLISGSY